MTRQMHATAGMRDRVPAQALIEEVLKRDEALPAPSRLARLLGSSPLDPASRAWYRGAQGERALAAALAELPAGWTVFHSVRVEDEPGDLGHVVVGPAGVLPVQAVHHPGRRVRIAGRTVLVAGTRVPAVVAAEAAAERLGRLLAAHGLGAAPVHPVVAVGGDSRLTMTERPRGVAVLRADRLRDWLRSRPEVLDADAVARIATLLDAPGGEQPAEAEPDLLLRFADLERRVQGAARRMLLLRVAAVPAGAVVAAAALVTVLH